MRRWLPFAALGAVCYLLFLLATLPASLLWGALAPPDAPEMAVSGTVWSGRAVARGDNAWAVQELRWRIDPGLRPAWRITAQLTGGSASAHLTPQLGGSLQLSAVALTGSLREILDAAGFAGLEGSARLNDGELTWDRQWPTRLLGTLILADLAIPAIGPSPLGDFTVDLRVEGERVIGLFRDLNGVLEIDGRWELDPSLRYSISGRLRTTARTPADWQSWIQLLGPADMQGWIPFALAGQN